MLDRLNNLDIFGKNIRIINNLYRQQTASIWIENEFSRYAKIGRGVR